MPIAPGSGTLRRMFGFGLLGVALMTVLAPGVALLRGTTGHDWYAGVKLTSVEIALALGFDAHARVVEYRRWDGKVERLSRHDLYWTGEALAARIRILATAGDYALLGGGIGGAVFVLTMLGAAGRGRRAVAAEPAMRPGRSRPGSEPGRAAAGRVAGGLRIGRTRVALLVVPEAEFAEMAARAGAIDPADRTPDAGLPDAPAGGAALPPPPPPPDAAGARVAGEDDAASTPAGGREGSGRIGLWA